MKTFERITVDPNKMGGVPCVRDMRMPVATLVRLVADGMSVDQILEEFPYLEADDITQALHYAAEAAQGHELPLQPGE